MTGRIEKTVFISYRRTNFWTALAVFQNLHSNGYDVFFDYKSIPSGDFEQVITENIKSRAHFIVILSPSALDRCNEPGDWLRKEIELAIESKRNIVPLMMEGFDFGKPATTNALTGKLAELKKYNAMGIPVEYFDEAMKKLCSERFLNRPLESVLQPISEKTKQITEDQKIAATEAAPVEKEELTAQEWFERSEAEAAYRKVIEVNPSDAAAYINLGKILQDNLKHYDEAEAAYRKAIDLNPSDATAYSNLGILLSYMLRHFEAIEAFEKAINLNPSNAAIYSNLGNVLANMKWYDRAEESYRKAIELNPSYATAYSHLGIILSDMKRYDEAEAAYRKAIELNPPEPNAYTNLASLFRNVNRYDEAEAAYRKAIELNTSDIAAYYNLIHLLNVNNG